MENHSMHNHKMMVESKTNVTEYLKFSGVLVFIALISFLLHYRYGAIGFIDYLRWLMGTTFMVFGIFKCIGYKYFVAMYPMYDLIAKKYENYAKIYPFLELTLATIYWFDLFGVYKDIFVLVLSAISAYGVYTQLRIKTKIQCACLGNIIKLPLSKVSLFENVAMTVMAFASLVLYFIGI